MSKLSLSKCVLTPGWSTRGFSMSQQHAKKIVQHANIFVEHPRKHSILLSAMPKTSFSTVEPRYKEVGYNKILL